MISIAIFLFVLAIVLPIFGQITERARLDSETRELETRAVFVSDAILKTSGYPRGWNSTTVKTAGFSDGGMLNITKIRSFLNMSYSDAKAALSISDLDFNITFYDIHDYSVFTGASQSPVAYFYVGSNNAQAQLNSNPIVWDLYYGGTGTPDLGNSRFFYNGTKTGVFNAMVGNQSGYKTIIIEEPQLTQAQVNIQGLKDFVNAGGILVFIGAADLISTGFSMSSGTDAGATGLVANESTFINGKSGENVTFNNSRWYFYSTGNDAKLDVLVASNNNPSWAFAGKWEHGLGTIYFLTDIAGTIGPGQFSSSANIVGKKIEQGTSFSQSASIYVVQRSALLAKDKNSFVKITFSLWK